MAHLHLGQEQQRHVVQGVAQDGLLHQQHVATRGGDLLAHGQDVGALLLQDAVHLKDCRRDGRGSEARGTEANEMKGWGGKGNGNEEEQEE